MKSGYWTLFGFLLLVLGFLSFILSMVGLKLDPLFLVNALPPLGRLVAQLVMMFGGVIIMYISRMEDEEE